MTEDAAMPVGQRVRYLGDDRYTVVRWEHVLGGGWLRVVIVRDGEPLTKAFSVWRDEVTNAWRRRR